MKYVVHFIDGEELEVIADRMTSYSGYEFINDVKDGPPDVLVIMPKLHVKYIETRVED